MAPLKTFSPKSLWASNACSKSTALEAEGLPKLLFQPATQKAAFFTVPDILTLAST